MQQKKIANELNTCAVDIVKCLENKSLKNGLNINAMLSVKMPDVWTPLWKKYKKSWSIFKSSYKNLAKCVSFIDTPFQ